jgi:CheY-like chemotaxis protein
MPAHTGAFLPTFGDYFPVHRLGPGARQYFRASIFYVRSDGYRFFPRKGSFGLSWHEIRIRKSVFTCLNSNPIPSKKRAMPASSADEVILIIDDEECIRDSCCQVLTKAGYRVETAINGEIGLAKAGEMRPDIALIDLDMPGAPGLEVMDRLNKISPGTIRIVVTGNTTLDLEKEIIRKRRALTYLTKPFSPEQLNLVVQKALNSRNSTRKEEERHGS